MAQELDPRKLIAEILGVFALVFAGAGAIILSVAHANVNLVAIALAYGLAFGLMVAALGHISGAHFNPAVTLGMWVTRRIGTVGAAGYLIAQLLGGTLAALALWGLFPSSMYDPIAMGTPVLGPQIEFLHGVGIEAILTFFLVTIIFGTAVDRRGPRPVGGLAIGLAITMGVLVSYPLTGAAMNPARAFGPALLSGEWTDQLVYWIGPIIGGVLAAMLYQYVFLEGREELEARHP
jgi:MIP family channel proteins